METRSRKRAEATSSALSQSSPPPRTTYSSSKRPRRSSSSSASPTSPVSARTRAAAAAAAAASSSSAHPPPTAPMDPAEPSNSRRDRHKPNSDNSDKGKEKEHDFRSSIRGREREREREREIERTLGLNIDRDDEDNDSEGGVGILHQNLTSASSALQGLLRKLGAGLDDLLPSPAMGSTSSSHQGGRLKRILSGLRHDGEQGRLVEALTQLCDMLSIGTEDSLSTFAVDSFVPVLVRLLNYESNPDIMLLAAMALTHLCDVLPSSCAAVVHYGAVSCFCARLLTIEYMDLAEQSLQALKKISQEHPTACLRAGALMAVLSYLDFFSTGVRRVALSTAANMCKKLPSDAADYVMEAVPLLTNLLQCHDSKVLEHASICLTRIAEAFASSPDKLDELCNHGLVTQAASLISTSNTGNAQASLNTPTYTGLIRLLSTCASGSHLGAKTLLLLGISGIFKDILSGSCVSANGLAPPVLTRPPEQIFEIVSLVNELLPPLPHGTITLPVCPNIFVKGPLLKKIPPSSSGKQDESNGNAQEVSAREKLLNEQPELLKQFGMDLLPVLIQTYGSSVNDPVRHKCLSVIAKLMYFSTSQMIQSLLSVTNVSSFLAGILAWKDPHVLVPALQIAGVLMEKLPDTFSKMFVREGVVHAVDELILAGHSNSTPPQASSAEKDNECSTAVTSRSRRYRRRGNNPNTDGSAIEESRNHVLANTVSPASSLEIPNVKSNLRFIVSACAKAFKDKYFLSDPGVADVGVTDDLLRLQDLCTKLNACIDDQNIKFKGKSKSAGSRTSDDSANKDETLTEIIAEMLSELRKRDGVSTFEFMGSGVIEALLNYFSCGYFFKERIMEANISELRQQALKRYKLFVAIALPSGTAEMTLAPLTVLVQKLQSSLLSLERFPVVLSHSSRSSGSGRISSGLSALSHPFKLRLSLASDEKSLLDYSSNTVLVDPLETLAAVEEFLWPRVQRGESCEKTSASAGNSESGSVAPVAGAASPSTSIPTSAARRPSTRSGSSVNIGDTNKKKNEPEKSSGSSKGKGKAILKPAQEGIGPQTRNATRRRAVLDKEAEVKPVNGESSSEEDKLDICPVEIDDALVMEDDDLPNDEDDGLSNDEDDDHEDEDVLIPDIQQKVLIPASMTEKVHDVKLGDSVEGNSVPDSTTDNQSTPASGSRSKAAISRGSDSTDLRSSAAFETRGAMSFAAAVMAGLGSTNGRGLRGGRDRQGRPLSGGSSEPPKLLFSVGGKQLSRHLTIYQAIQRQLVLDEDDEDRFVSNDFVSGEGNRFWSDIYTITYQKAEDQGDDRTSSGGSSKNSISKSTRSVPSTSNSDVQQQRMSLLDSILQGELPCDLEKSNPTYNMLALLRVLEGLNQLAPRLRGQIIVDNFAEGKILNLDELNVTGAQVPAEDFINSKLTAKLSRQIQDALALCSGRLPSWCFQLTKACPFLFPFETRRQYFYSTAFGLSRALYRLQQQQGADGHTSANDREVRVGRLQRQKVRVSRNRILDSAVNVMEMYSSQKAVLEVEYFGEVGTGLGPTLEFYTLLSHNLQKRNLKMWRSSSSLEVSSMDVDLNEQNKKNRNADSTVEDGEMIVSPLGLFPRPWPPNTDLSDSSKFSKVIDYFRLLGRVMAKAFQDGRLMDLPLSPAFYKLVIGQELDLHDISSFDAEFGKTLEELNALVCRKKFLESSYHESSGAIADLRFHGALVEEVCLDFTLPGYPDFILKAEDETVDIHNLEEYLSLVVDATVKTGISRQVEAFRAGFNQVFDISFLQIFSPHELDYLLCGRPELWQAETLTEHIKFDHGYTAKSPAIINLLEIMGEFTPEQQRTFCQFVTGAPRLPPGGLAVLNPKLTIVRKHSSTATNVPTNGVGPLESADDDLLSVMTCANYLKLPPYSSKEIMYKKLMYAINEGRGSFDLS